MTVLLGVLSVRTKNARISAKHLSGANLHLHGTWEKVGHLPPLWGSDGKKDHG